MFQLERLISPIFAQVCPEAYRNMCQSDLWSSCRIGPYNPAKPRPFSAVTMVADFSSHKHRDKYNKIGGAVAVLSLTRDTSKGVKQYHVLPHYSLRPGSSVGNLSLDLEMASVLIEVAKYEWHCTTSLGQSASRIDPSRIGLVWIHHGGLDLPCHGQWVYTAGFFGGPSQGFLQSLGFK